VNYVRPVTAWAVAIEARDDPGGILLIVEDRGEAESIAAELRERGVKAVVRPVAKVDPGAQPGGPDRAPGEA
jgi:hypothetical protein